MQADQGFIAICHTIHRGEVTHRASYRQQLQLYYCCSGRRRTTTLAPFGTADKWVIKNAPIYAFSATRAETVVLYSNLSKRLSCSPLCCFDDLDLRLRRQRGCSFFQLVTAMLVATRRHCQPAPAWSPPAVFRSLNCKPLGHRSVAAYTPTVARHRSDRLGGRYAVTLRGAAGREPVAACGRSVQGRIQNGTVRWRHLAIVFRFIICYSFSFSVFGY